MANEWTVLGILNATRDYLASKGFENARLEAEMLVAHVLSSSRIELYLKHDRPMSNGEIARSRALLKRRLAGEPVQYITGSAAFMFTDFRVDPRVLIPRPETEALVEAALEALRERAACDRGLRVADVGTGSGVIAVTIALRFGEARVWASDVSEEVVALAAGNAERAGVRERIEFLVGADLEPFAQAGLENKLDAVVSNPPYVPTGDLASLPREVREHEPAVALDGGEDGLDCLRTIAHDGPRFLVPGGVLALEVGDGQAERVAGLLREGLEDVEVRRDYAGRDRIVVGTRSREERHREG